MTKLNKLEATIGDLSLSMEQLKIESAQVKTGWIDEIRNQRTEGKNKALKKRIIDNQSRSMRDNLVSDNVKEDEKFTEDEKVDTEAVLVKFIKEEMKVKSEIRFERVHRMGKAKQCTDGSIIPAPILAKFSFFKQREEIRRAGVNLKSSKAGVSEQFPPEICAIRKKYWPILKQARQKGKQQRWLSISFSSMVYCVKKIRRQARMALKSQR